MALFVSILAKVENGSCHEMFVDDYGNPITLKWADIHYGAAYLKINGDNLKGNHDLNFYYAKSAWELASDKVRLVLTNYNNSNVDLGTPTQDAWENKLGGFAKDTLGLTELRTTDGLYHL